MDIQQTWHGDRCTSWSISPPASSQTTACNACSTRAVILHVLCHVRRSVTVSIHRLATCGVTVSFCTRFGPWVKGPTAPNGPTTMSYTVCRVATVCLHRLDALVPSTSSWSTAGEAKQNCYPALPSTNSCFLIRNPDHHQRPTFEVILDLLRGERAEEFIHGSTHDASTTERLGDPPHAATDRYLDLQVGFLPEYHELQHW